ncbi:hypothetical protein DYB25_006589 [Aphanomyces astaci]|uniref:DNA mismatch repair proteins mutS family domain-containing protein n=1 Tax=Aphanomyces astaci TaxID=112090 RepID=A0A397BB04_APHAT|nr:hypothetical protein DYB25_006589 [Aphanomyces astaci]
MDDNEASQDVTPGYVTMAVQIRSKKQQNEVGVAVRRPRPRKSCVRNAPGEDKNQWELILFSFIDCNQLSTLDNLLVQVAPSECLAMDSDADNKVFRLLLQSHGVERTSVPSKRFKTTASAMEPTLCRLLGATGIQATHRVEMDMELALGALAAIVDTHSLLVDTDGFGTYSLSVGDVDSVMQLDRAALTALNLLPDPMLTGTHQTQNASVLDLLNRGKTAMGRRMLERWIRMPLMDATLIAERQEVVATFVHESTLRMELLDECMKALPDLEKLAVTLGKLKSVKLDHLVSVYDAASSVLPRIVRALAGQDVLRESFQVPLEKVQRDFQGFIGLVDELVDFDARPYVTVNAKHDEALRDIRAALQQVEADIDDEHDRVRHDIGGDVKCEKDKVRGYVFRLINKKEEERLSKMKHVHICQVLVNGLYFTTSRLKELGKAYQQHVADYEARQMHILTAAIDVAATYVPVIESAATLVGTLDVLLGFAHVASHAGYCRPAVSASGFVVDGARHPCVELQDGVQFIPNNVDMDAHTSRFQLITGPNMGGKSTYIRALGAITVMAQIGSFVPATSAMLPIVDKLLVRVGAGDMQQRGVSTFMLEMLEAAVICRKATARSLVIIDELGRGTSTYDGFGLAWAISDFLVRRRCWCVFATHFHELTALGGSDGVVNKHLTAHTADNHIAMVYEVRPGPCLESFGIHVAEMAGFPPSVVAVAKRKATELEHFDFKSSSQHQTADDQPITKRLRALDVPAMTDDAVLAAVAALL